MRLILLSLLFHSYVAIRLLVPLMQWPVVAGALGAVLVASAFLLPAGLRGRRRRARRGARLLTWAGLLGLGLFSSLLVLTVLRDAMLLAAWVVRAVRPQAFDAGTLEATSAAAVALGAGLVTAWGYLNARRTAEVVSVDVPIPGLPVALDGFTIVQISDLHVGPTIRGAYVRRVVRRVNSLGADAIAITGDLVDGSVAELADHVAPLAGLRSRHGTYFVTGNHDYYSGAHAWIRALQELDVRVLLNEHVVLRAGSACLVLAGVTDFGAQHFDPAHRSDPQRAITGAPSDAAVRVLLAHQPRTALAAWQAGFDLQLSGHTHGGQFLPWNFFVRLQQPYTAGLHRLHGMWIYVSRGTGYWGPPKRFGAPSEITRVRLVSVFDRSAGASPIP